MSSPSCCKSNPQNRSGRSGEALLANALPTPAKVTFLRQPPMPSLSLRGSLCPAKANQNCLGHPSGIRPYWNMWFTYRPKPPGLLGAYRAAFSGHGIQRGPAWLHITISCVVFKTSDSQVPGAGFSLLYSILGTGHWDRDRFRMHCC